MYTHPANFILNLRFKMKKPCYFPVDFVYCRENRYSEFLFYLTHQNSCSSANIGRANVVCRVRWANIWTRSVHYITLLCIWPHIICIILLIINIWTISFYLNIHNNNIIVNGNNLNTQCRWNLRVSRADNWFLRKQKSEQALLAPTRCRWSGSNRYGITTTGFWVQRVCQFHHTGKS